MLKTVPKYYSSPCVLMFSFG